MAVQYVAQVRVPTGARGKYRWEDIAEPEGYDEAKTRMAKYRLYHGAMADLRVTTRQDAKSREARRLRDRRNRPKHECYGCGSQWLTMAGMSSPSPGVLLCRKCQSVRSKPQRLCVGCCELPWRRDPELGCWACGRGYERERTG